MRYFKGPKSLTDFYSSFWDVPVAGATLPVIAFLLLGIYGNVVWLLIGTLFWGSDIWGFICSIVRKSNTEIQ